MADIAELNAILTTCGITKQTKRTRIIDHEGFTTVANFAQLEGDKDVDNMAKRLMTRPQYRVLLGAIQIKTLQYLVYWVTDRVKRGQAVPAEEFTIASMNEAKIAKGLQK